MITGIDERSRWAIDQLIQGKKPKYLMEKGLTESQSKKLSQFVKCLRQLEEHTTELECKKWRELGLKGLVLLSLFREENWEGLRDALLSIDSSMKRDEIAKLPALVKEKQEATSELARSVENRVNVLKRKKKKLLEQIETVKQEQEEIKKQLPNILQQIEDSDAVDFLLDHLGLKGEKLCLAKRLDYRWQQSLKKKGVIRYGGGVKIRGDDDFSHYVEDVQQLAQEYIKRVKRGYRVEYDSDNVPDSSWWAPSLYAEYNGISSLKKVKGRKLAAEQKKIKEIEKEIQEAEQELTDFKKKRPESFEESLNRSNLFSKMDLEAHGGLQALGMKWLYGQGYIATTEVTLPGNLRCDVIGYNEEGHICIIECKASRQDYIRDEKWQKYLPYCHQFYFLAPKELAEHISYDYEHSKVRGVLIGHKTYVEVLKEGPFRDKVTDPKLIIFSIGRNLSKRFAFGSK